MFVNYAFDISINAELFISTCISKLGKTDKNYLRNLILLCVKFTYTELNSA